MRVVGLFAIALVATLGPGCATTHVSQARFVSRSPVGGVVATPRAEVGMDDANAMIAAHCGSGGYSITREGEALVGDTVVTEGANSLDAQTTAGGGQVQGHDSSRTVFATGSDWQVHYTCNDASTVSMGLITRSRVEPSKLTWGADVGAGAMLRAGHAMDSDPKYRATRGGTGTALAANGWLGVRLSNKFALGGGIGVAQIVAMPQWDYRYDSGANRSLLFEDQADATALELFASARYAVATRVELGVRIGMSTWRDVEVDGVTPLAAIQLGYRVLDVGPGSGVYVSAGLASHFSSSLTNNASPALLIGFH